MTKAKTKPKPEPAAVDYSGGVEYVHADTDTVYYVYNAAGASNLERAGWTMKPKKKLKGVK